MLTKLTLHTLIATAVVGLFAVTWQAMAPTGAAGPRAEHHADARND